MLRGYRSQASLFGADLALHTVRTINSSGLTKGRTGVFSRCLISWFYLGNYSSWLVIWRFCVTREELKSWSHHSILRDFETGVLRMVGVVYREWLWYVICKALRDFAFFKHSFLCKNRLFKRVSYLLIFVNREKKIFTPVILYFLCSWNVPEGPPPPSPPCTTLSTCCVYFCCRLPDKSCHQKKTNFLLYDR